MIENNIALIATTILSTPLGFLVILQALENQRYSVGFLKLMLATSPISLGAYFIENVSHVYLVACWSAYCILNVPPILFEAYRKGLYFFQNNPYRREINIRDFKR